MRRFATARSRIGALCLCLVVALSLAVAPATEAVKHGAGAYAAEADHGPVHGDHGHEHQPPGSERGDPADHDHVMAALLPGPGAEFHPAPKRTLRPDSQTAVGTIRDGPRRPPRLALI